MSYYLGLFVITATTVGKVMLCTVVGMAASRYFSDRERSQQGFNFISVRILMPSMLFSNLCLNVTWESVSKFYCAPLLACVPLLFGLSCSFVLRLLLSRKYYALMTLGCTFQNGLTFPLALVMNLKGIAWLDAKAVEDAQSYIFLYNIVCSIGLWAIGDPLIAAARNAELQYEEEMTHKWEDEHRDGVEAALAGEPSQQSFAYPYQEEMRPCNGNSDPHSPCSRDEGGAEEVDGAAPSSNSDSQDHGSNDDTAHHKKRSADATEQLSWYRPARPLDRPMKPPPPPTVYTDGRTGEIITVEVDVAAGADRPSSWSPARIAKIVVTSLMSPTVSFSLAAIFVSLTPPLRWLASSFIGEMLIGGLGVVGSGTIPLQLLILGCTVVANSPSEAEATADSADASPGPASPVGDAPSAEALAQARERQRRTEVRALVKARQNEGGPLAERLSQCAKPAVIFIVSSIVLRLLMVPTLCLAVIHALRTAGLIPDERPFLLAMLIATCAPSAINSSVICSMHNYHAKEFARMIFFMYLFSIFSMAVWLFVYVLYLGDH